MESPCEKVNPLQFALNLFKLRTQSVLPVAISNLPFKPTAGSGLGALSRLELEFNNNVLIFFYLFLW